MATIYKLGSRGEEVKAIQRALRTAGYQVSIDGDYGQKTMAAVKAFQQDHGLRVTGGVNQQMIEAMVEAVKNPTPAPEATPAP